jgi:hypothetical protein
MSNESKADDSIERELNPGFTQSQIERRAAQNRREFKEFTVRLESELKELDNHPVASRVTSLDDVRIFLEWQGYAVLSYLTMVNLVVPLPGYFHWHPPHPDEKLHPVVLDYGNTWVSKKQRMTKYEIVYEALSALDGDTEGLNRYVNVISRRRSLEDTQHEAPRLFKDEVEEAERSLKVALDEAEVSQPIRDYMTTAWNIAKQGQTHRTAGAIAFGMRSITPYGFGGKVRQIYFDESGFIPQQDRGKSNEADCTFYRLNYPLEFDAERHEYFYPGTIVKTGQTKDETLESAKRMIDARLQFLDALENQLRANGSSRDTR